MQSSQSDLPLETNFHPQPKPIFDSSTRKLVKISLDSTQSSDVPATSRSAPSRRTNRDGTQDIRSLTKDELIAIVESLRRQLDQTQRMAILGELTAMTTHEFNNLLMTMLNYAKIGLRHKDEATRDKALQRIFDSANKASRLTCGVLALARNRSGNKEPTDLRQVVEDCALLLEREFRKYQVQLVLELNEVPPINGVGNELQRVLINLMVNARQATRPGGQVRITLKEDVQAGEVLLAIRDTGSGIAPDILPRIFDPYFTTKSGPDASGRGGNGLGLSACKEVIDAHDGRIRVESSLGKGTLFTIRLPKAK